MVEVLAVVVILGMVMATVMVGFGGRTDTARHELARTQIGTLVQAVQTFQLARSRLPTQQEGLAVLTEDPQASYYVEPSRLADPWSNPYYFLVPGQDGHPFEIMTYGADGVAGGDGSAADITSNDLGARSDEQ